MQIFIKNDEAYLNWVAANPGGYVLNTDARPGTAYRVLHRATCGQISSPSRKNYTTGLYIKLCALDVGELEAWAGAEGGGDLSPCGLCRPEYQAEAEGPAVAGEPTSEEVCGFEYWIRGYQNFYEPMILAYFRDQGYKATKAGSTIERGDLEKAALRLEEGSRACGLNDEEKRACIVLFRKRTRIQTDGILQKTDPSGESLFYSVECKSWGGFCSSADTLNYFLSGPGGWFMLVDSIRDKSIRGSVLVVGGERPKNPEDIVEELRMRYHTEVEVYYLKEIFIDPGPNLRAAIRHQLAQLDVCVANIRKDLNA